ncbi:MAG TPA: hypothetical protein VMW47_11600 [Verrucomicrobiae bacterium]|nr:hypothetical protein [Verrucomicrobiae bacterium]
MPAVAPPLTHEVASWLQAVADAVDAGWRFRAGSRPAGRAPRLLQVCARPRGTLREPSRAAGAEPLSDLAAGLTGALLLLAVVVVR